MLGIAGAGGIGPFMWLVPGLAFASFFVVLFGGRRMPDRGHWTGIVAAGAGLLLSLWGFAGLATGAEAVHRSWTWFQFPGISVGFGMTYDFLAGIMFIVVTTVSLMAQIYSTAYMRDEPRYTWFYAALSLFTGSMLLLVLADNLVQLFLGWELVGLCSYFLIGHFWESSENSSAAIKAFITTRIGDVGLLFGTFVLFIGAHTFDIAALNRAAAAGHIGQGVLTAGALLLFLGAIGKSAQFPLHVWLPDAMAGPSPVSALIHAATMVVAGVYLVARMFLVFRAAHAALDVVSIIAAITMLIAAAAALVQDDIKRVLAYSTVSQIGYMMAAMGVGAYSASIFHLFTHAFFKALLFLGAGSLIHATGSNYMSDMGGLRTRMPHTFWTFLVGAAALAGIFPLAGFFSKDEIVGEALRAASSGRQITAWIVFASAVVSALLTALYVTKLCVRVFYGEYRGSTILHESPRGMTGPLWALTAATLGAGFLGLPVVGVFRHWINIPGEAAPGFSTLYNLVLPLGSLVVALAGVWVGWQVWARGRFVLEVKGTKLAPLYTFVAHKYYLDDLYLNVIVRPIQYEAARGAYSWLDRRVIDGLVEGSAHITGRVGGALRILQSGHLQRYLALLFAVLVVVAGVVMN